MSILINNQLRLIVQGITGNEGLFHTQQMLFYHTNIVAGVSPGKGGDWVMDGKVPVFDTVKNAVEVTDANASVIFVPAKHAADAIFEAVDAGLDLVVCITEGVPTLDMMRVKEYMRTKTTRLIGPNCPGILVPGQGKVGIIPSTIAIPGSIGVVSRSGTLTYEVLYSLKKLNKGVSACIGIGGDPIKGMNFVDVLELFESDAHTDTVIMIGEIGGDDEELAAEFIARQMTKPVAAFIAGASAPPGKRMGHAGAIIEGSTGTAEEKIELLRSVGVKIADHPEQLATLV
jgi:succinyl-CoA synthetase alpha subunit